MKNLSFQITRYALLTLVALSLTDWGQRTFLSEESSAGGDALPADGLMVINFFGSLLPLAVKEHSIWLVPALFGIGSAAPVLVFALALTIFRKAAGRAVKRLQNAQR